MHVCVHVPQWVQWLPWHYVCLWTRN